MIYNKSILAKSLGREAMEIYETLRLKIIIQRKEVKKKKMRENGDCYSHPLHQ